MDVNLHTVPEFGDIALLLGFFVMLFLSTRLLARVRGHRD